jgi:ActR/RegA family two-component response regulator
MNRVLMVDDDQTVARALARVLRRDAVIEIAHTSATALDRLRTEHFVLVLIDIHLGAESGMELYERMRLELPETAARVAFMSGAAEITEVADWVAATGRPLLSKPFDFEAVRELIRRASGELEP